MKTKRKYIPENLKIETWDSVEIYFNELKNSDLNSVGELKNWLLFRSELESALSEDLGWRYIRMSCDTQDKTLTDRFEYFISEIEPRIAELDFELNKKIYNCQFSNELTGKEYKILIRDIKNDIELFKQENVPIMAEVQKKEKEYGRIAAEMTINYRNEEITLQKATNFLKETDIKIREEVFKLIWQRRLKDKSILDELLTHLIEKRQLIAENAGFINFRDYMFRKLARFDYSIEDCFAFHNSVLSEVVPLTNKIQEIRKNKLGLEILKPWDLDVDENLKSPLKPFTDGADLIEKAIRCFRNIKPEYGEYLQIMNTESYLDLDSRKGKAPGGFNYPLHESNIPFIFMNSTGNIRDLETMVHEGGHAIHSFLTKDLELVQFKETPSEIAELASMSMELISMEHWEVFFPDKDELRRAKLAQLYGTIQILPWAAMIDKFQHLLYLEPDLSGERRKELWKQISVEFSGNVVDWSGLEDIFNYLWQKQLHIFEVPFYYIEYGFAQLGAIAIWRNYKLNPSKALNEYESALKLGYTRTIPEVYNAAGIQFNFSKAYIRELMNFVKSEIDGLNG